MSDASEVCGSQAVRGTTYVLALCFCSRHARNDSFLDPFPLELGQRRQYVKLQLACRRGAVDALAQTYERHTDMLEVFEHGHEVPEVASESIQTPADQHVEASALGVPEQAIEGGSPVLRTTDARIDVFGAGPATSLAVTPKLQELVLARLIAGRDAGVDRSASGCSQCSHRFAPR